MTFSQPFLLSNFGSEQTAALRISTALCEGAALRGGPDCVEERLDAHKDALSGSSLFPVRAELWVAFLSA